VIEVKVGGLGVRLAVGDGEVAGEVAGGAIRKTHGRRPSGGGARNEEEARNRH
jgi:hypothetical protein